MKTTDGIKRFIPSSFGRTGSVAVAATSASVLVFLLLLQGSRSPAVSESTSAIRGSYRDNSATPTAPKPVSGRENSVFSISKSKLVALGLEIQPVCRGDWPRRLKVTGQLELCYRAFDELIDLEKLRAHARPIDTKEAFHQLARYLEVRVDP